MKKSAKEITVLALLTAIICVLSPWTIPIGVIPISLATFSVMLISGIGGIKRSVIATAVYILLGAVGVPVFSNFKGGFSVLTGVTGGYIIGYLFLAFFVSFFCKIIKKTYIAVPLGAIIGTIFVYLVGTVWFVLLTKSGIDYAFKVCVFPFLIGDGIKIAVSMVVVSLVKPRLSTIFK